MTGLKRKSIASAAIAASLIACLAAAPAALAQPAVDIDFISLGNPGFDPPAALDLFDDPIGDWFVLDGNLTPDVSGGQLHLDAQDFLVLPVVADPASDAIVVADIVVSALPPGLSVNLVVANNDASLSISYAGNIAYLIDQDGTVLGQSATLDAATTVELIFVQPAGGGAPFAQVNPGSGLVTIENTATALSSILFVGFQLQDGDGDGFSPPADCNDADAAINPGADDSNCDGVDNNCSGVADDGFVSSSTTCGVGACASTGDTSCVGGGIVDSCTEGAPNDDANCDGIDDDCDGTADDDFVSGSTTCGTGACASTGDTSCVDGGIVDSCIAGVPAGSDATCDGIDNDCNGAVDDGFVSDFSCFLPGACADGNIGSSCSDGFETSCSTGTPAADDATCDGEDDDCDGETDEDFVSETTTCGVGACASTGTTSCIEGSSEDSCTPGDPAEEVCDGVDNDCDGDEDNVDEGNALIFYLDDDGDGFGNPNTPEFGCEPSDDSYIEDGTDCNDNDGNINPGAAELCDEIDNDCDGSTDEDGVCPCDIDVEDDEDCNENGVADTCDLDDPANDVDNDGVLNECDNCPVVANDDQLDSDGDGEGDACDTPAPDSGGGGTSNDFNDSGTTDDDGSFTGTAVGSDGQVRAEVEVIGSAPGAEFNLTLSGGNADGTPGGTFAGFADGVALTRTLTIESDATNGTFAATIAIYFTDDELTDAGLVAADIEVHVLDDVTGAWVPAGTSVGNATPPVGDVARAAAVGQSGFFHDDANGRWCFWAVVDHFSMFAVGAAEVAQVADLPADEPADDGTDVVLDPGDAPNGGDTTPPPADEPPADQPAPADDDGDGVANADDLCLRTEAGTTVDAAGCPLEEPPTQTEPTQEIQCGNGLAPCGVMGMLGLWGMLAGLGLMKFAKPRSRRR